MSKKTLEKWYSELKNNLWSDFAFYIPKNDLTTELSDKLDGVNMSEIFNKVYIIDKMRGPIEYKIEMSHKVFSKDTMLDDNIYLLLKMKRKLNLQEFDFLSEKYFKQVEPFFVITNWIKLDLSTKSIDQMNNTFKGMFELQQNIYKEHFGKLIKHFYPNRNELPESNLNLIEIIEEYFPNLLKKGKGINIDNNDVATLFKNKEIVYKSNKKELLLTEKDAEAFLLESVFNLENK